MSGSELAAWRIHDVKGKKTMKTTLATKLSLHACRFLLRTNLVEDIAKRLFF